MRQHRAAHDKGAFDIDTQHGLQRLERRIERGAHPGNPGIVDQEVDLLETTEGRSGGAINLLGLAHISGNRETPDLGRDRLRSAAVPVEHGDSHTFACQPERDRPPDAAAAPGDQPDPPVQRVHDPSSSPAPIRVNVIATPPVPTSQDRGITPLRAEKSLFATVFIAFGQLLARQIP
jgi:hypothetical protein